MPVLVIQMGHVGRTSGATGAPGEQAFTQTVGDACYRLLQRDGWTVRLLGADPPAEAYRGDAFVAVHADGNTNPAVRGASVGYRNQAGADLAHAWRAAYTRRGYTGPWHEDNYTSNLHFYYGTGVALVQGNERACIIEAGTITNPVDRALITGPGGPERVALAIGDALNITPPPQETNVNITQEEIRAIAVAVLDVDLGGGWTLANAARALTVGEAGVRSAGELAAAIGGAASGVGTLLSRPPLQLDQATVAELVEQMSNRLGEGLKQLMELACADAVKFVLLNGASTPV